MARILGTHRAVRRTRRPARPARLVVVAAAVLAGLLGLSQVASAYFSSSGSGTGTASTGTLAAPTAVTATPSAGSGTVAVSWTASAGTPTPTGYYVRRLPSSGPAQPACGTSAASTIAATSCSDDGVAVGTYTYEVVAVFRSWTATSAPSPAVTVAQATQTITITSTPVDPSVGGTYNLTATGGLSGNPIVFSSATTGVCTVSGSTVTFGHAGPCTINANQAGSTYYSAAPQVQQTFAVAKAAQPVGFLSAAPSAAVVGGAGYTPIVNGGGGSGNPVVVTVDATTSSNCSISGGVVRYQHAGSCTVDANQAGNADYLPGSAQQSYAIGKGSQAINFGTVNPVATVGDSYTPGVTAGASGNPVVIGTSPSTVCTSADGVHVTYVGAGTCTITADQAGNADYLAAAQVQQQTNVSKRGQSITFTSTAPAAAAFGGSYSAAATASSGLTVTFSTDTASVCTVSITGSVAFVGVGTCHVNADQAGDTQYAAATPAQQSFTVATANQTITFGALGGKTYGNAPFTVGATATSGLTVTFSSATAPVCTVTGTTVTIVGAGTCTINANQAGDTNWNAAPQVSRSFAVAKGNQTITFIQPTSPVTATSSASLVFSSDAGLVVTMTPTDATVCSVSGTTVSYLKAGTCTLTATQAGDTNYNAASQVVRSVTVNLASQTITFNQPTTPANAGTSAPLVATSTSGLTVAFTTPSAATICTITGGTTVNYVGAGNCVVNANQAGNVTYSAATQVQRTVVVQASDTTAPSITNIMNGRAGLTWTNNNMGSSSWNGAACAGNQLCATIADSGTPTSGVDASTITFSLVGATGLNAGKCYDTTTAGFKASPCAITVSFNSGTGVATASVAQADMLDGTYTFVINAKDNAGNAAVQQTVTLTIS